MLDDASGPGPRESGAGTPLLEVLQGLPIAAPQRIAQVRLAPVVAATTRAALDMIFGGQTPRRPLLASHDDGALDLILPEFHPDALSAAGALVETIEGSIGPAGGGSLRLRVPLHAPRPIFLLLEQGTLAIAIPWHTVIRVRLVRPEALETVARREGYAVLPRFVSAPHRATERPAVLVGFGMRRAFFCADRLVWRMPAQTVQVAEATPRPGLAQAVRTADGDVYWAIDPARLLSGVEPHHLTAPAPSSPPVRPATPRAKPVPPSESRPVRPRLVELKREHVEPLEATPDEAPPSEPRAAPALTEPMAEPAPPAPTAEPAARPAPVIARRVLVAEDSITGRIFLHRLLEMLGFAVESVGSARDLERALDRGPWDALFLDVDLPDSPRARHLRASEARAGGAPARRVALVRDLEDERAAAAAGVTHSLRKPFEPAELARVVEAIGLGNPR